MPVELVVFDAYGTLFDVAGAARAAAAEPGREALAERWPALSETWRLKQLQYSWHRAVAADHVDFWRVTCDALDYALEAVGLGGDAELAERLRALYRALPAYPEVPAMLDALAAAGRRAAILSNGSPEMLDAAIRSAGLERRLEAALSVEEVGAFKPDRRVYALVERRLGVAPERVLFVSANGWDAAAAGAFGFHVLWVNRLGAPVDRLPEPPRHVATELSGAPALAAAL
jgi:2-haloacid dehalogenase